MTEEQARRYLDQYQYGIEVLVDMLAHMAKRRDLAAIEWLVKAFAVATAAAGQSVKEGDLMN
jgi:hypothetical protein